MLYVISLHTVYIYATRCCHAASSVSCCFFCRALIPAISIKPLDASPKILGLKRTVGFLKASKELSRHQDLLQHALTIMHDDDNQSGGDNDFDDEQVM